MKEETNGFKRIKVIIGITISAFVLLGFLWTGAQNLVLKNSDIEENKVRGINNQRIIAVNKENYDTEWTSLKESILKMELNIEYLTKSMEKLEKRLDKK